MQQMWTGRNYYSCRRFDYLARNCKTWDLVAQGGRIQYGDNLNTANNLEKKENLKTTGFL